MKRSAKPDPNSGGIPKAPTGISGLDELTEGGLPKGRPTLVCGAAGCGKTMLGIEFLVRGAAEFGEPGVFMMFEENADELIANVRSLGFDLEKLTKEKKVLLDHVHVERSEIEETGEYDLEGLFIRLGHAIDSIGAKRVVLDTLEALFAGLPNHAILRAELRRLFRWLKDRGVTAVITGERGENSLTRYGLEEYVADCVILLDHRVSGQVSTRRLRVVKYRGSSHGTNEYPFFIGHKGLSILPITSLQLDHKASRERVSSGIPQLDSMLTGGGFYKGSSILVTGAPGTGKSSFGAAFIDAACSRGERAMIFAFEESADQMIRNMRSINIRLEKWVKKGLLQIHASRPTLQGLEQHLVMMHDKIDDFGAEVVLVDPLTSLSPDHSDEIEARPTLIRLIDYLKLHGITAMFSSLTRNATAEMSPEESQAGISSLMDTWLLLRNQEANGERNRTVFVLKSRGMKHSNQVREFTLTDDGIKFLDAYLGGQQVLTGTARILQESREQAARKLRRQDQEQRIQRSAARVAAINARIEALREEAEAELAETEFATLERTLETEMINEDFKAMRSARQPNLTDTMDGKNL
jgi:circadian clock protein KaiC